MTGIDPQAETLLIKAAEDEVVLQFAGIPPGPFGFHVQQAAEKLIKALLSQLQVEFARTHDLVGLSGLLKQAGVDLPLSNAILSDLYHYAVAYRYDHLLQTQGLDRSESVENLRILRRFVEARIAALSATP
jgi:HEPN domain-containing protein